MYNLFSCLVCSKFTIFSFEVNQLKIGYATTDLKSATIWLKYTVGSTLLVICFSLAWILSCTLSTCNVGKIETYILVCISSASTMCSFWASWDIVPLWISLVFCSYVGESRNASIHWRTFCLISSILTQWTQGMLPQTKMGLLSKIPSWSLITMLKNCFSLIIV